MAAWFHKVVREFAESTGRRTKELSSPYKPNVQKLKSHVGYEFLVRFARMLTFERRNVWSGLLLDESPLNTVVENCRSRLKVDEKYFDLTICWRNFFCQIRILSHRRPILISFSDLTVLFPQLT